MLHTQIKLSYEQSGGEECVRFCLRLAFHCIRHCSTAHTARQCSEFFVLNRNGLEQPSCINSRLQYLDMLPLQLSTCLIETDTQCHFMAIAMRYLNSNYGAGCSSHSSSSSCCFSCSFWSTLELLFDCA